MKKTYSPKPSDIDRRWFVVDADGKTLGRLSTEIARILSGKNKPQYAPHVDTAVQLRAIQDRGDPACGQGDAAEEQDRTTPAEEAQGLRRAGASALGAATGRAGSGLKRHPGECK